MLNIPGGRPLPQIPTLGSRVPKPEEVVILPPSLIRAIVKLGRELKDVQEKWALGGDAAEVVKGVSVRPSWLELVTTAKGVSEICGVLAEAVKTQPGLVESRLERDADIGGKVYPVFIRSTYAELDVEGVKVKLFGDMQYKVGDWEWGDPLDFEAETVNIVGVTVPTLPLTLKSELDLGLGWMDRVELISDAILRSQHRH